MRKKLIVKSAAWACIGALAVSPLSITNIVPVLAYENISGTDVTVSNLIGVLDTGDIADYKWIGYIGCDVDSSYKYLKITYSGDAAALAGMRWQFMNSHDESLGYFWFTENAQGTIKTVEGTLVPEATSEEQTVIIDLVASGVDVSDGISAFHVHSNGATGSITISDAAFMKEVISDENVGDGITLDGNEAGESSLIGEYKAPTKKGEPIDDYKYLGFATLKDATPDYKYLIMTYTGNITQLRFQFANVVDGSETSITEPYWFNAEGQSYYFVTADESAIPLSVDKQTIVIDLEKTGISLADYNSIHMHCDLMATYGNFSIVNARLSTSPVVVEADKEAPVKTEDETTTEEKTTEEVTEKTTTEAQTKKVKAPGKTKIKNVEHKKGSKRLKVSLAKVKRADGYQVKVSTKKGFSKKKTITVNTKKLKVTVKKLKKSNKYYVKARAYVVVNKSKKYGKWTKVKIVK